MQRRLGVDMQRRVERQQELTDEVYLRIANHNNRMDLEPRQNKMRSFMDSKATYWGFLALGLISAVVLIISVINITKK
jgi:hypothetical protein